MKIDEMSADRLEELSAALMDFDHGSVARRLRDLFPEAFKAPGATPAAVAADAGLSGCARLLMRNAEAPEEGLVAGMTADQLDDAAADPALLAEWMPALLRGGPGALRLAMQAAADADCAQTVRMLSPHCDPCALSEDGRSLMVRAASANHAESLRALLEDPRARESLRQWDRGHKECPLGIAAQWGCLGCVEALLPHVDPDALRQDGQTALMRAAQCAELECVKLLARRGDPSVATEDGLRAFDFAVNAAFDDFGADEEEDLQNARWAIVDELGAWEPLENLAKISSNACGSAKMPRFAARREAEALRAEFDSAAEAARGRGAAAGEPRSSAQKRAPKSL